MTEETIKKRLYHVSVKDLAEFVINHGDIDYRYRKSATAIEGIRAHQTIQKRRPNDYLAEVTVEGIYETDDYIFSIKGRIDGVFLDKEIPVVEEIKSSYLAMDEIKESDKFTHLAQAKIYAYLYATQKDLSFIDVQMTYVNLMGFHEESYLNHFDLIQLSEFYHLCLEEYCAWQNKLFEWEKKRNKSLNDLEFPFKNYRKGQRELSVSVYRSLLEEKNLFLQAPTGLGKTIGVLFPNLKALAENKLDKIFYLTAKNMGRVVAEETIKIVLESAEIKAVVITAKDKTCFNLDKACEPDSCSYAKDYYKKLKDVLPKLWENNLFNQQTIEKLGREYELCPFELSLDLSNWVDVIICDYNYVYDPIVYLRRFFDDNKLKYSLLVDESHNLVDRARSSYSAAVNRDWIKKIKLNLPENHNVMMESLEKIDQQFKSFKKRFSKSIKFEKVYVDKVIPRGLVTPFNSFIAAVDNWLADENSFEAYSELKEFYFEVNRFLKMRDFFNDKYRFIFDFSKKNWAINLMCLDPSQWIKEKADASSLAVYFSATLKPFDYFKKTIEGDCESYDVEFDSPFNQKNLKVVVNTEVSTKYKERDEFYGVAAQKIVEFISVKKGNYILYFPSFAYLEKIKEIFEEQYSEINLLSQSREMTVVDRNDFLNSFHDTSEIIGLAVMGGSFGEGIDLVGNRLIGVGVVGVGLPMVCVENNLLKDYFDEQYHKGFEYAYQLPGIQKILQTSGRVIRSENDVGVICLIDNRYKQSSYLKHLPKYWDTTMLSSNNRTIKEELSVFWNQNNN
ncbi:MAG: ATP-dependent helicase [Planctomycetota bacterium]|nr:MAG: ATP-dependent helicase [Planctomycetota bacterium]